MNRNNKQLDLQLRGTSKRKADRGARGKGGGGTIDGRFKVASLVAARRSGLPAQASRLKVQGLLIRYGLLALTLALLRYPKWPSVHGN